MPKVLPFRHYVVMPYVDGRTLEQAMDAGETWTLRT